MKSYNYSLAAAVGFSNALYEGHYFLQVYLLRRLKQLVLQMLQQHLFVKIHTLLSQHVQRSHVLQLSSLLQQFTGHLIVRLQAESVAVHVAKVDHSITVIQLIGIYEVLVCLLVTPLH